MRLHSLVLGMIVLAVVGGTLAVVATREGTSGSVEGSDVPAAGWRGLVSATRSQVAVGQRVIVLLRAPSLADRVARAGGAATNVQEKRWTQAAIAAQQEVLADLAFRGVAVRPERRFTRTVNGFSAAVDPSSIPLLERSEAVRGVFTVRVAYPAASGRSPLRPSTIEGGLSSMPSALAGFDGSGVTVALLDTGVDTRTPFLHGHALPGIDVVSNEPQARPRHRPGSPATLERHGTEMAGIIAGSTGGPLTGVAPNATVLPIRVAGWQRDAVGRWSLHARTDQILAGLERAVDPNGDGAVHDAVRIAVVPLGEPFAAFSDGPLARAAAGALELGTLLVAPAGNDGPAGPAFGSISGPGGAPAVLTVAAADLRGRTVEAPLAVRVGLRVLFRRPAPVLGALGPSTDASLSLVSIRSGSSLDELFDARGLSRIAGRAVLVRAGPAPRQTVARLARAGAGLVLLAGGGLPAGGLGLHGAAGTPVLGVPRSLVSLLRSSRRAGGRASVSVGEADARINGSAGGVTSFSSQGLGFGGHPKPELAGPGVGVVTAEPGSEADGTSRFVTVSGSSAAAAVVAGEAALLVQARPALDARALRSVLVGTARRPEADVSAPGLVDLGAAAAAEVVADPATISFGRGGADGTAARVLVLRNVSPRRITIYVGTPTRSRSPVTLSVSPRRAVVAPGGSLRVRLRVRARPIRLARDSVVTGALTIAPVGGEPLRVPWGIVLAPVEDALIGELRLSARRFKPSDAARVVLALQLGRVERVDGVAEVEPVLRVDIELWNEKRRRIGLLARLRDVLPGRYAYGLTGRGPGGKVLRKGTYRLRVVAWPAAGGRAVTRSVRFAIE
jgi:subtilisin family serine protease